jgi:3-oxoacyl-[acyl-carrier protein] reductase
LPGVAFFPDHGSGSVDLQLRGKVALVMAASEGIGRACAEALAREGAMVAICARNEANLERAAREIGAVSGSRVEPVVADVSSPTDIKRFVEAAAMKFGSRGIDVLVTNTGSPPPMPFLETTDEQWMKSFEMLFLGPARAIRHAVPHMRSGGSVVCLSSWSVREPIPHLVLSNAIRPAVAGLAKTLATELAPQGIRVNGVLPGPVATRRITELDEDRARREGRTGAEMRRERERGVPLGRLASPHEIASAVVWLASPAASYVTGQMLAVDGGVLRSW